MIDQERFEVIGINPEKISGSLFLNSIKISQTIQQGQSNCTLEFNEGEFETIKPVLEKMFLKDGFEVCIEKIVGEKTKANCCIKKRKSLFKKIVDYCSDERRIWQTASTLSYALCLCLMLFLCFSTAKYIATTPDFNLSPDSPLVQFFRNQKSDNKPGAQK